ncbi:MAG: PqqD family protein [Candidatus Acidiferrales bacterium]
MNEEKWAQNPNLAWREIDGEVVIISPEDSLVHELNATASFLWKQLNGRRSVKELAGMLAREFEVDLETARADISELMSFLHQRRLLFAASNGDAAHE